MAQLIEVPGMGVVEFPDGMSDDQIATAIKANMSQAAPQQAPAISSLDKIGVGVADPIHGGAQLLTKILPNGVVRAGNQLNNWIADKTGLVASLPDGGVDQQVRERETDYQAQRKAAGESGFDGWRTLGNVVSPANAVLASRGVGAATTGARIMGGAVTGAASALMNPVTQGDFIDEKAKQVATGAAFGGAVPAIAAGVGRVISPSASRNPQLQMLRNDGVRPTIGQTMGGRWNSLEEKLQSVPVVGDMIANRRAGVLEQFNNAAINRVGAPIGQRVQGTGSQAVQEIGDIASKAQDSAKNMIGAFQLDAQGAADIARIKSMIPGIADKRARNAVSETLKTVQSQMSNRGVILPDGYKTLDSHLTTIGGRFKGSTDAYQQQAGDAIAELQNALRNTALRQNPAAAKAMQDANAAWANLVRIEGASKAAANNGGLFTPGQLMSSVRQADKSVRDRATARGTALMQDFATSGQSILGNKVPNSFTTDRALIGAGALGGSSLLSPLATAGILGGAGLYTQPVQSLLTGAIAARPQSAQAVRKALLEASPALVPLGSQVGLGLLNAPGP